MNDFAIRHQNAWTKFTQSIMDIHGFTQQQADHILKVYIKAKAVKLDIAIGTYNVKHGAFMDKDVMLNALKVQA